MSPYRSLVTGLVLHASVCENKRIYLKCEGRIEKSVPRITVWHHEAWRVMPNGDPKRWIFQYYPHTKNGFFFLLTAVFLNKLPEVLEYAKMQFHMMTSL